jgi:serine/threonine protein kinase
VPQDLNNGFVGPADALDRYEMVERRAAGGEGEVWQAVERHGTESFGYAVKLIRPEEGGDDDRALDALRLQAALATQLEHPALVKVREVFVGPPPHPAGEGGSTPGRRLYFVMKWIAGQSLQEALERGELRGLDVLAPLEPIAEAIDYLHSGRDTNGAPVIHRDIKPANVLLAADGRVYLVDFGLVRLRSTSQTSRIFGTAPFMAPESLARGEYTPASDRYTLGATVYYALTGETPVPGDNDGMAARLGAALGRGTDREIRGILAMLAPSPDSRPPSAAGWLRALRTAPPETTAGTPAAFAGPPTSGPPSSGRPLSGPRAAGPPAAGPRFPSTAGFPGPPGSVRPGSVGGPGGPATGRPGPPGMPPFNRPAPPPPPVLPASVGGYLGGPTGAPRKKSKKKVPIIIVSVVLGLVLVCCGGTYALNPYLQSHGYGSSGTDASPAPSFDKKQAPPPVTSLRPVLVSVGDITATMSVDNDSVAKNSSADELYGGLSQLSLCAEGTIAGDAIGGTDSNSFYVSSDGYAYVGSAVAGFYADEAKTYFKAVRSNAERCGWRQMQTSKLGDETYGTYYDGEDVDGEVAIVFVRKGQVIMEVAIKSNGRGSYQADTINLATAMAKRLPAAK